MARGFECMFGRCSSTRRKCLRGFDSMSLFLFLFFRFSITRILLFYEYSKGFSPFCYLHFSYHNFTSFFFLSFTIFNFIFIFIYISNFRHEKRDIYLITSDLNTYSRQITRPIKQLDFFAFFANAKEKLQKCYFSS